MTKILRIEYSPYILYATKAPNSRAKNVEREGCLLKFLFKDIGFGYADCHPLPEFGDDPLQRQLSLLKEKKFTVLTQRSLYFARLDSTFRNDRISAFSDDNKTLNPKNHFTSPALIRKEDILLRKTEGFTKFKFKFGRHNDHELNYLQDNAQFFSDNQIKIRIDYNGNLKAAETLNILKEYKEIIDFIEDPFFTLGKYHNDILEKYSQYFKFAMDFINPDETSSQSALAEQYFTYKIVKPARDTFRKLEYKTPKKFIFTSSMDHPSGQMCALFEARNNTQEHCGLTTHYNFEPNEYSKQLIVKNSCLLPVEGIGFGFEGLLNAEKWKKCF